MALGSGHLDPGKEDMPRPSLPLKSLLEMVSQLSVAHFPRFYNFLVIFNY